MFFVTKNIGQGFLKEVFEMKKLTVIDWLALGLLIVGGLNWGLVGAFKFDLVAAVLGQMTILATLVYVAVGLAALKTIVILTMQRRQ